MDSDARGASDVRRFLLRAALLLSVPVVPGVAVGTGLYWLYRRSTQGVSSEPLRGGLWWVSVLGGGALGCLCGVLAAALVGALSIGAGDDARGLIIFPILSGVAGIAFGAGWGQGEKLA